MSKNKVCLTSDIPRNGMRECATESGLKLLVASSGEAFYAVQAICPHQEGALCAGLSDGTTRTCHQHLGQGDLMPGQQRGPVGGAPVW